ncbi:MAG: 3-dehydroquinate synthase [Alphaproteobacteria bacterium]|nr:3-dehydroquinate synthase [Alphaproteobacteria bacterium]
MHHEPLTVALGARSYPICFGPLSGLGAAAAERLTPGPCALVSNTRVGPLYAEAAADSLRAAGFAPRVYTLVDGEAYKTLGAWQALIEAMLADGVERGTAVFALGGGVTGDIAGFAAASTLRGLPFVQVPTSLLAMVDSSVGGKTGVNSAAGKNLVGAFHQPRLVWVALHTLDTLDDAELRCGLGEVIKHALLEDPGLFAWLEQEGGRLLRRDREALLHAVRRCCEIKAAVVAEDEHERGRRAVLNLGHTVGHALEHALGYGALRHGEAVGLGMLAEAWLAVSLGLAEPALPARIEALLRALGLPWRLPNLTEAAWIAGLRMDKKRTRGRLRAVIPTAVGAVEMVVVEPDELAAVCQRVNQGQEDR